MLEKQFGEPVLIPANPIQGLETVPFHVATIEPKLASTMMGLLAEAAPLTGFPHVKRIRRPLGQKGPMKLDIILCQAQLLSRSNEADSATQAADSGDSGYDAVPPCVGAILEEHGLTYVKVVQVPKNPAATREQWAEWNQLWPISWIVPSGQSREAEVKLSEEERVCMRQWMARATEEADAAVQSGAARNAAIIVDSASGRVVAVGRDCSASHPLHHAVMTAVHAAAASNLSMWPEDRNADPSHAPGARGKLQRAEGCADVSQGIVGKQSSEAKLPQQSCTSTDRPYLCTGYDCYVVQEPCAMCAMALVHSRVRRVCFCKPDAEYGALGGSFRLHSHRSLNHHYSVFRIPTAEEPQLDPG